MAVAFVAGVPFSYVFGSRWLSNFAYRVNLEWWLFALPVLMLFFMTTIVVVAQSLRNSLSNPVDSLRHE
jgi:putative ABC transport system permease protein